VSKWSTGQGNVIVIYVETSPNSAHQYENSFYHLSEMGALICVIKHLHSDIFDFGDSVGAIITIPLLGQRLVKALQRLEQSFNERSLRSYISTHENSKPPKILIVDDNDVNRKVAGLHTEKAGYSFAIAENGQEALKMFRDHDYDLILMDCMMPVMDGYEATKKIRQFEQDSNKKSNIPIIALTASVSDDDIQKCFDVGMDDYMPKPFKADALKEKLYKFLSVELNQNNTSNSYHDLVKTPNKVPVPLKNDCFSGYAGRVLLVEDNHINQKVASLMLKKAGYQLEIADNGKIAVDKYKNDSSFSVILMDCMMPVMDGFEATKKIRAYERRLGLKKIPIIALTASVLDDDILRCYDSGMDAYVPTPLRTYSLLYQIENTNVSES
jgi:CheY-like chemotaxis protein